MTSEFSRIGRSAGGACLAITETVALWKPTQIVVFGCARPGHFLAGCRPDRFQGQGLSRRDGPDFGRRRPARAIGAPRSAKGRLIGELRDGRSRLSFNPPEPVEVSSHGEGSRRAG